MGCIRLDIALRTRTQRGWAKATLSMVSSSASIFLASNDIVFCAVWWYGACVDGLVSGGFGWKICECGIRRVFGTVEIFDRQSFQHLHFFRVPLLQHDLLASSYLPSLSHV